MARLGGRGRPHHFTCCSNRYTGEGDRYAILGVGGRHRNSPGSSRWCRHLGRRSPHCHRPDHHGCSLRRRRCCHSGAQGHLQALRGPSEQMGWCSPWQWGRPGLGSQRAAPSWQMQVVQASGSQRAPWGQARPSPQHWGAAGWHSQDSSCLTFTCSSLFWGKEVGG